MLLNGEDLTGVPSHTWVVDFDARSEEEARRYALPFAHVERHVKPFRRGNRDAKRATYWWRLARPYTALRDALRPLGRYIATSEVAKHRVFAWVDGKTLPSGSLIVIAAEDDFTYGVVNSTLHTTWAVHLGQTLEDRPRYTPTTTFETFPFPRPTAAQREAVARAAVYLEACREHLRAFTPPLTLTGMYNALADYRRTGVPLTEGVRALADAHDRLDQAVAAAYGWTWPLGEEDILAQLLALNEERAGDRADQLGDGHPGLESSGERMTTVGRQN